MQSLADELSQLRNELNKLKGEVGAQFRAVNEGLAGKADKSELVDLENRLIEKINDLIKNLFN